MPEPILPTELPQPQRLTVGETPVYLKKPLEVNGKQVTELTIKGTSTRGIDGIESSVLLLKEQSRRRGEEGQAFIKPLNNVSAMEEVDWEKVGGVQYAMPDGTIHTIPKDQLSLVKPELQAVPTTPASQETPVEQPASLPQSPSREAGSGSARQSPEPKLARSILETYSGEPTTLTIVGLKAYETRAHDLADKAMQLKTSLGERVWKQGVGPAYFHEQARQYYDQMLKAAQSPFAEQSIKIAEAAGKNRYQELLTNKNFLTRPTRQFIEWMKDTLGVQTLSQKFALEEIAHMRETGEIKERESFDREAGAIRKRFEQDVDIQDQFIRGSLGEKLTILDPANAEYKPLVDVVKRLVKQYATGDIATKKDFDKVTDELFQKHLKTARRDVFDQAELYTSSLFEVAENLRAKASHEGGLAAVDAQLESMQVRLGMGVMGEATALVPSDVEKGTKAVVRAVDWMEKKGIIGPFVFNEATVASAVALSLSLSFLPRMGLSTLANGVFTLGGGAAVGGLFAGLREYRHLEKEYLTHIRERESGLTFAPDAKRRAWMEKFMVGQRSADDLITSIRTPIYESDGKTLRSSLSTDELRASMANLADAKARRALSGRTDSQRVGLIQFTGRDNIETQRTALDVTIAQTQKDIAGYLAAHTEVTGLNPVNQSTDEFITQLTAAQTRIINEGMSRVEGLDDPIKVTLGLLDKYNPEVEIMRRRFPLIGADQKTGAKAQGLEQIFAEFRRAAAGEAVKKGLQVGLTSAALGFISREVMQTGLETGAAVITKEPVFGPPVHIGNTDYQFANNLHLDTSGNLVDNKHTVIAGFEAFIKGNGGLNADGTLTDTAKQAIINEAKDKGVALDIPNAVKTTYAFSGETHVITNPAGGDVISVPKELDWQIISGSKQLVLHAKDAQGNPIDQILSTQADGAPATQSLESIAAQHPSLLYRQAEELLPTTMNNHDVTLPLIPPITSEPGFPLALHASIPDGTNLVETKVESGIKVFDLIDAHGKQLLTDVKINEFGEIQSYQTALAHDNSLHVTMDPFQIATGGSETGTAAGGEFTKAVADMGSTPNEHGVWNWMLETIHADKDVKHLLPATNLTKNLFRGYEENMIDKGNVFLTDSSGHVTKVSDAMNIPYGAMGNGYEFHQLPKSLFFDQPINGKIPLVELGKLMDRAIDIKEIQGFDFNVATAAELKMSQQEFDVLKAAYDIGRVGNVATEAQVKMFMEYMGSTGGGAEKTVTLFRPVIEQMTTETIPAHIIGVPGDHVSNLIALHEAITVPELPYLAIPLIIRQPLELADLLVPPIDIPPGPPVPPPYHTGYYGDYPEQKWWKTKGDQSVVEYLNWLEKTKQSISYESYKKNADGTVVHGDGTPIRRDMKREQTRIHEYLDRLDPAYQKEIDELAASLPPMTEQCRVALILPMYHEQKHAYNTLKLWSEQNGDPSRFEIDVIINREAHIPDDNTSQEVMRFIKDYPDAKVNLITKVFPTGTGGVPTARKYITDIALLRSMNRSNPAGPLYIASEDADMIKIDNQTIDRIIERFDQNPHFDALKGKQYHDIESLKTHDFMLFERMGDYVREQILRDQRLRPEVNQDYDLFWNRIWTGGWNTAFTAESYAQIDGYNPKIIGGEDVDIGRKLSLLRSSEERDGIKVPFTYTVGTNPSKHHASPRRWVHANWQRFAPYDKFNDEQVNSVVKNMPIEDMLKEMGDLERLNETNKDRFAEILSSARGMFHAMTTNPQLAEKLFTRFSMMMGVGGYKMETDAQGNKQKISTNDYTLLNNSAWKRDIRINPKSGIVELENIDNLAFTLKKYREGNQTSTPWTIVQGENGLQQLNRETKPNEITPPSAQPVQSEQPVAHSVAEAGLPPQPEPAATTVEASPAVTTTPTPPTQP